jgi:predicted nucleic acid binding AN1-type Zn finger protein
MPPCKFCKQRSVLEFKCLCNHVFCVRHRLPEDHSCTVDRMKEEREILAKNLVKVVADKLPERV